MLRSLLIISIVFIFSLLQAQTDTLRVSGLYYGSNVFVYNNSKEDLFGLKKIIVNNDTITDELNYNGIEIDLESYQMEEESRVNILLIYAASLAPVVVNPDALMPSVRFRITKPKYLKDNVIQWKVNGIPGDDPVVVEQYRYNSWRVVAEIDPVDTVANNVYTLTVKPHSGNNQFRVRCHDINNEELISKELLFNPGFAKNGIQNIKYESEIVLNYKAEFELYNEEGTLVKSGEDRYIKTSDLPKGKYLLFVDNQIIEIKKK